jgi:hypothetical protein
MKYTLVKYKKIKLLVNEGLQMQPLIDHLFDIEVLNEKVTSFYKNVLNEGGESAAAIASEQQALISKIGYKIIGVPFTNHDAELYALDKKLDYEILELHGNTGKTNAAKNETKQSQIQMRISTEQKAMWVKKAQKKKMKLTEWITKKLNDEF